ncbi:MAG: hypothetical protein WC654_06860, partial [Patescibacteria group bacterium]
RYDEEYVKEGLGEIESRLAALDGQISGGKGTRDTSISKTRRNPFYSAATITGETAEVEQQANRNIGNLIDERNSLAEQYNTKLGKVNTRISQETEDKAREIESLRFDLNRYDQSISDYRGELRSQLNFDTEAERWEAEFGLRLADAKKAKTSVSEFEADGKLYRDVFNNETGELVRRETLGNAPAGTGSSSESERFADRITQGVEPDPGLRSAAERLISQGVSDPTEAGYSGTTAARLEAEMSWLRSGGGKKVTGTMSESEFRKAVRKKWETSSTPDEIKSLWGDVTIEGGKTPTEVIDDEWSIKTKPGFMGWLGRAFRLGV